MKQIMVTAVLLTGALLGSGCATKKYVNKTVSPVQTKVEQQGASIEQNRQTSEKSIKDVDERATTGISAAKERAMSAENRAGEAMNKATQAGQTAEEARNLGNQNAQGLNQLKDVVSNLEDYQLQGEVTVPFKFDSYRLKEDAKQQLDNLVTEKGKLRRYFIAVEGFTDRTGSMQYNEALSRRRADAVVQYLVTKHDVPIYRIHMIGLGKFKPVDEGRKRASRAKNRRVEVKIYSADKTLASLNPQGTGQNPSPQTSQTPQTEPQAQGTK